MFGFVQLYAVLNKKKIPKRGYQNESNASPGIV